jgi:hypothetical protein
MSTVENTTFSHILGPKLTIYVQIDPRGATKRDTAQPQYDVEYGVMGTGPIVILIVATERISLDVEMFVEPSSAPQ